MRIPRCKLKKGLSLFLITPSYNSSYWDEFRLLEILKPHLFNLDTTFMNSEVTKMDGRYVSWFLNKSEYSLLFIFLRWHQTNSLLTMSLPERGKHIFLLQTRQPSEVHWEMTVLYKRKFRGDLLRRFQTTQTYVVEISSTDITLSPLKTEIDSTHVNPFYSKSPWILLNFRYSQ